MEIRSVGPGDADALAELFAEIDTTYFLPHDMSPEGARAISGLQGQDVYLVGWEDGRPIAYGMLRGWDEGFDTASLGVAVRSANHGQGQGRAMVLALHEAARAHGSATVRLRVSPDNDRARHLYESIGYRAAGMERDEVLMLFDLGDGGPQG